MAWLAVGVLLTALVLALVGPLAQANELFVLEVRRGALIVTRGRLPGRLHDELEDIVQRAQVHSGRIRVVTENRRPAATTEGLSAEVSQRVRNVVGMFRVADIRAGAPRPTRAR